MARIDNNDIVELSILLNKIRKNYDFKLESYSFPGESGVLVTLYPVGSFIGGYGNGKHKTSFAIAFAEAEHQLKQASVSEAVDYQNTIDDFLMGTGRL